MDDKEKLLKKEMQILRLKMKILKMDKESEKFYKVFCKKTQSKNGMWEQRFYTDGRLAPCWGYQIDETASVGTEFFGAYSPVRLDPASVTRSEYENGGAWQFNIICEEPVPNVFSGMTDLAAVLDELKA